MNRAATVLVAVSLAWTGTSCVGSATEMPRVGSRVRVSVLRDSIATTPERAEPRFVGKLARVDGDTLVVHPDGITAPLTISIDRVRLLEVSRGRRSRAGNGAAIGFGVGVAAGVATALIVCAGGNCAVDGGDITGIVAAAFGLGGGVAGLGIGALAGGQTHTEIWERVPLRETGMERGPSGGGAPLLGASFTYRF
jgi:hypothetical protein